MPRWTPSLFTGILLAVLTVVLGHAAEHAGWLDGVFHPASVADCRHADSHSAPCGNPACHSHEAAPDLNLAAPMASRPAQAECLICPAPCVSLPPPTIPLAGLSPADSGDPGRLRMGWSAGSSPLLV